VSTESSNQNRPKNQHWVPQFYLRYFATPDTRDTKLPKVWRLDALSETSDTALMAVENVCGKRYLYSPVDPEGNRDWSVESWLDRIETASGDFWPHLTTEMFDLSSPEMREGLSKLLAIMHLRNFSYSKLISHSFALRDKLYGKPTEESLKDRPAEWPDPTDAGRFFVQSLQRDVSRVAELFAAKRWVVFYGDEDLLLTSDRPVTFVHGGVKNASLATPGAMGIFPLSPNRVLCMTGPELSEKDNVFIPLTPEFARSFNISVSTQCIRFVISKKPFDDFLDDEDFARGLDLNRRERAVDATE